MKQVDINEILIDTKIKKKIVLSTTNGKYEVIAHIKHWSPTYEYLGNYYTAVIRPERLEYKGKNYGANIKYLVDLKYNNGSEQILAIHKDPKYNTLKDLHLTPDILSSKSSLETFFREQKEAGTISFEDIKILDFEDEVRQIREHYKEESLRAETHNFFQYRIIGKIKSAWVDFNLWWENRQLRKNRKE